MCRQLEAFNIDSLPIVSACLVITGGFLCYFICGGITLSFGISLIELVREFPDTRVQVESIGSLQSGFKCFVGLVVGALLTKFSHRQVTIIGSLIVCLSYVIVSQSRDVTVIVIFFGVISGCGFGLMSVSSLVAVNIRFAKTRALVSGIAISGTGIGLVSFSWIINALNNVYGWRGAVLILGAVSLNGVVIGLMISPLMIGLVTKTDKITSKEEQILNSVELLQNATKNNEEQDFSCEAIQTHNDLKTIKLDCAQAHKQFYTYDVGFLRRSVDHLTHSVSEDEGIHDNKTKDISNHKNIRSIYERGACVSYSESCLPRATEIIHSTNLMREHSLIERDIKVVNYPTNLICEHSQSIIECNRKPNEPICIEAYSGLMQDNIVNNERSFTEFCSQQTNRRLGRLHRILRSTFVKNMILCFSDRRFLCLYVTFAIWSSQSLIIFYIPDLVLTNGLERTVAVTTMSIGGVSNMAGRLGMGLVASYTNISSLTLYGIANIVASVTVFSLPWAQHASFFYIIAIPCGGSFGSLATLRSVVLVDMLGVDILAQSLSSVVVIEGCGILLYQLIVGYIRDSTSSYVPPLTFIASLLLVNVIITAYVYFYSNRVKANTQKDP